MKDRGWNVTGLDFSENTVERLRAELGLNALAGTLPHPHLIPGSFDLVTLWHSLEHVHQPLAVLREIHRLLRAGRANSRRLAQHRKHLLHVVRRRLVWIGSAAASHAFLTRDIA